MSSKPGAFPEPKQERSTATIQKLVDATIDMLNERGEAGVRVDDLLEITGISRGSLYHHFGGRDGLLVAAMAQQYSHLLATDIDSIEAVLGSVDSAEEMVARLVETTRDAQAPERAGQRLTRAAIIGASAARPLLAEALAAEQQKLTTRFTGLAAALQQRGWIRSDIEPEIIAVFIQAFTFGRVLSDISSQPADPDQWNMMVAAFVRDFLFTD
jgi:AcrR family transcriptional regulator